MFHRFRHRRLIVPDDRGPLRVMFVLTSMPVGGAETLLVELVRRFDRDRFAPEICCLKDLGPLGEMLAREVPAHGRLIHGRYDARVLGRLRRLFLQRRIDAVITVGTGGDRMFWGRLAARLARVPVICSAIHSTGYPDRIERVNKLLTPITDGFIAVADAHAQYLVDEGCPTRKVFVIPNGVDVDRFRPRWPSDRILKELQITADTPTVGIVAALRPEKDHESFLKAAAIIARQRPEARFVIVGDGDRREPLEQLCRELSLHEAVHFLGNRSDVEEVLSSFDVLLLTSRMEANPVSLLEAMAAEIPVVAPRVGSIPETVRDGRHGYLTEPGDVEQIAAHTLKLLAEPDLAATMGRAGREEVVTHWSVERMVQGYEELIDRIYRRKAQPTVRTANPPAAQPDEQPAHPAG